jgi:DNA-binding FadR family transcriptional regulator
VFESYEVRHLVEPAISEFAAQRITPLEAACLREIVGFASNELTPDRYAEAVALNCDFHVGIAQASGNRRLADVYTSLTDGLTRVIHYEAANGYASGAWRYEHLTILETIARHDPIAAGALVRETILNTSVQMRKGVWLRFRDLAAPSRVDREPVTSLDPAVRAWPG